jgi:copper homeostasis protein
MLVEAAVETLGSAIAAERSGAGRVELCASLHDGGTTPGAGMIGAATARLQIPVFVLIRPRGGGFVYSDDEIEVMKRDVELARSEGAAGVVTGALDDKGRVEIATTRALIKAAGGLPVTFHRAFDAVADLSEALEMLIDAGATRVLTSGGANTALEGAQTIARLVEQSNGRIIIVAGGGIREHNVREVIALTGVFEVHARLIDEARMRELVGLTKQ